MAKHGGKRPGSGRKRTSPEETVADKGCAARLIEVMNEEAKPNEPYEIQKWRELWTAQDLRIRLDVRKYLYDKRDGKAVQTVNHVHDKPIDVNVPGLQSLADAIRAGRQRVQEMKKK